MKKLAILFTFFAFFGLIFIGCQGTEDITAPGELNKPGPVLVTADPDAGTSPYTVDLIQGQFDDVGDVTITKTASGGLTILYAIDGDRDCQVTEVHVDLAKMLSTPTRIDFNVNSQGSPNFGNFDTKDWGSADFTDPQNVVVTFTKADVAAALGVSEANIPSKIYIAVHGVVCCDETTSSSICPPMETDTLTSFTKPADYYFHLVFKTGEYDGWCIDPVRPLSSDPYPIGDLPIGIHFLCSYNWQALPCIVDKPENLDLVNWIINNRPGYGPVYRDQILAAIWYLLSNDVAWQSTPFGQSVDYMPLVNLAIANGEGFVPGCGQKVLVIGYNQDGTDLNPCNNITRQVIALEVPVECTTSCETAMGFPFDTPAYPDAADDTYSKLFPGSQWFRYIAINY